MTKKHVPVFLNDELVGRAEIFDLDATIKILLTNDRVMPALMADEFRYLSIGWGYVVKPTEGLKQLQIANFSMRGHIAMCDDCYRCFNMFDHDKTALYAHGREHGAESTVITVVPERDLRR